MGRSIIDSSNNEAGGAEDRPGKPQLTNSELQVQINQLNDRAFLTETINDASIDRILAVDTELRVIAWNKMCEIITGIDKGRILGKSLLEFFPETKLNDDITRAIDMAMKGVKMFVPADKASHGDEYCEHHFVPLKGKDGTVIGVLNIIHDVAHRIKVENELKALNKSLVKKNKELKQKNAEIASFSYVASHDLKEPLRKIYTFIELLLVKEVGNISEQGRAYFKRIQASAQRMSLLTDDMLAFTQLNSEKKVLSEVDLNEVLATVLFELKDAAAKDVSIDADTLPTISGYKGMLHVLFLQLLSNAIKFQPEGGCPRIQVRAKHVSGTETPHPDMVKDAQYLALSFIDNGIGFETEYSDNIFKMFKRLHSSDKYPGTGMGLTLCKKIAELHNGFMSVESLPGAGSTFTCYLPSRLKNS